MRCAPLRVAVGGTAPRAHAPRPLAPTFARILRCHLTFPIFSVVGRAASAAKSWSVMDLSRPAKRTLGAGVSPVDDATARAQAHRRGVAWLLFESRRCRSALRERTLTPHTIPCLTLVLAFRATGRRFGASDQGRVSLVAATAGALRSRACPVSPRPTADSAPVEPSLQARRTADDVPTRCWSTASSPKGTPSPPHRPRAFAMPAPRVLLRLRGHLSPHACCGRLTHLTSAPRANLRAPGDHPVHHPRLLFELRTQVRAARSHGQHAGSGLTARVFFPVWGVAGLHPSRAVALPLAAAAAHLAAPNSSPALGPRLGVLGVAIGSLGGDAERSAGTWLLRAAAKPRAVRGPRRLDSRPRAGPRARCLGRRRRRHAGRRLRASPGPLGAR
jgi:hypothetical protein